MGRKEFAITIAGRLVPIGKLLKETFFEWLDDNALRLGAALSYYTIFSLIPTLVVVVGVAGLIFGQEAAQSQILNQVASLIGQDAANGIEKMLLEARRPQLGILATIFGLLTLLIGASGVFVELQDALNTIWNVRPKTVSGLRLFLKYRLISFGIVLSIGLLLLASITITTALAAVGDFLSNLWNLPEDFLYTLDFLASFAGITFLFALMFKFLPDIKITWPDVWIGAAVTSLLFTVGKYFIAFYLAKSSISTSFGAAGSIVLILLWVYYSSQAIFLGAEFTQVFARRFGSRVRAAKRMNRNETPEALPKSN